MSDTYEYYKLKKVQIINLKNTRNITFYVVILFAGGRVS